MSKLLVLETPTQESIKVRAITYQNYATPFALKTLYIPIANKESIVTPTEVLVKVMTTSVNPVDCILKNFSNNYFGPKFKIPGGDFAGIVVKAGSESGYKEGDKIYGDCLSLNKRGSFSDSIIFEPKKAFVCEKIPDGMPFEEAGSLACVSNTAFESLRKYNGNLYGKNVLVLGAGTSVGFFAVQFAKYYFNAKNVVATCSSQSSFKTTKAGADLTIDYTKSEVSKLEALLEFVKIHGFFDIIVDCVRDESVISNFPNLLQKGKDGGIFTQITGSYTLDYKNIHLYNMIPSWRYLYNKWKYQLGFSDYPIVATWTERDEEYGAAIEKLWKENKLDIVIDSSYNAYKDFNEAFEKVATCTAKGKVILNWNNPE